MQQATIINQIIIGDSSESKSWTSLTNLTLMLYKWACTLLHNVTLIPDDDRRGIRRIVKHNVDLLQISRLGS